MEARVETGGDDRSMLDIKIDRLIGLLAADENQAIVSSAMIILVNLGPAAFARLTAAMYTTEDGRLRIRTIEVLGVCCQSHPGAVAILVAALNLVVEPRALGASRRALCATMHTLALRCDDTRPEPKRGGRNKPRPTATSRGRKTVTGANHSRPAMRPTRDGRACHHDRRW
jgi:hypothetical protein